ncbi:hypothetical protein RON40_08770 [Lactobacillus jensenii]|uniref:PAS domain-containing protein n=1 Tax=Lactobacillus jensenii TaxID=109790 RepID=A0ABU9FIN9_LACJE|nr:hypothetical protein [Lactobacillus jensenii]MDT9545652.1 hypothetical protein [Lactobacillus jensenii]
MKNTSKSPKKEFQMYLGPEGFGYINEKSEKYIIDINKFTDAVLFGYSLEEAEKYIIHKVN